MNVDHIREKQPFNKKDELKIQKELIDELYDVIDLVTYEQWRDVIMEFHLLNKQGYVLSEKQMDYAEGIKSRLIERRIL